MTKQINASGSGAVVQLAQVHLKQPVRLFAQNAKLAWDLSNIMVDRTGACMNVCLQIAQQRIFNVPWVKRTRAQHLQVEQQERLRGPQTKAAINTIETATECEAPGYATVRRVVLYRHPTTGKFLRIDDQIDD